MTTAPRTRTGIHGDIAGPLNKFLLMPRHEPGMPDPHRFPVFPRLPSGPLRMDGVHRSSIALPEHFIGRRREMQYVLHSLLSGRRIVTIQGPPGIGKTAMAKVRHPPVAPAPCKPTPMFAC